MDRAKLEERIRLSLIEGTKSFVGELNTPATRAAIVHQVKSLLAEYDQLGLIVPRLSVLVHRGDQRRIMVVSNERLREMWNSDELEDWEIAS